MDALCFRASTAHATIPVPHASNMASGCAIGKFGHLAPAAATWPPAEDDGGGRVQEEAEEQQEAVEHGQDRQARVGDAHDRLDDALGRAHFRSPRLAACRRSC